MITFLENSEIRYAFLINSLMRCKDNKKRFFLYGQRAKNYQRFTYINTRNWGERQGYHRDYLNLKIYTNKHNSLYYNYLQTYLHKIPVRSFFFPPRLRCLY